MGTILFLGGGIEGEVQEQKSILLQKVDTDPLYMCLVISYRMCYTPKYAILRIVRYGQGLKRVNFMNAMIQVDAIAKQEAQEIFQRLGLTVSDAVNLFLRQTVREQAIPFHVGQPVYNEETRKAIEDARS